ncbi:MAG: exo-alpha-sialidase [Fimbriimonadaceae bacterium]|nr:exo-alpha-sialidase [Fimbriimonadaceae bacterium]
MKRALIISILAIMAFAAAQNPIVNNQIRVSLDDVSKSATETSAAASANGQEIVAGFVDARTDGSYKSGFSVTSNGGQTWEHIIVRPPAAFQSTTEADPMTAYDPRTNTLFVGAIAGGKGMYVAKKIPGQNAFTPAVMCRITTGADKGWMTAGPLPGQPNSTRLYIGYNEGMIWSDDLGATWTNPLSMGAGVGFLPRVGPQGELYLTYWEYLGFGIQFRRSFDGGQTWDAPVQAATRLATWGVVNYGVPGIFRNVHNHAMAVNPVNGEIVLVYFDQTNIVDGRKNLDLYLIKSADQGQTWSNAVRLPFRPLNQISDMIFPWLEFTKDGRLHLMTMDTSFNPGQADGLINGLWDQVYYYSDNAGDTWSQAFRLTPTSWNSANDGLGGWFSGDYQGMAASDKAMFPVYPDAHTLQHEAYINVIYNPIERPLSYAWVTGIPVSGTLESLFLADGNAVQVKPLYVPIRSEPQIRVETTTTVPSSAPSSMKVCLWASTTIANIQQHIQLKNVITGNWDTVDSRVAALSLSNVTATVPTPANYISGNTVKARIVYKANDFAMGRAWTASIDQCVLLVDP